MSADGAQALERLQAYVETPQQRFTMDVADVQIQSNTLAITVVRKHGGLRK